jgi:hypothetical protein
MRRRIRIGWSLFCICLLLLGCRSEPEPPLDPALQNLQVSPPSLEEVGERLIGPIIYTIDARSPTDWTYFDFSRNSVVTVGERESLDWDLAFRRYKVLSNSGKTNPKGGGGIIDLGSVDFYAVQNAPEEGYVIDTQGKNFLETENQAIRSWYAYSAMTNTLKTKNHTYIIRTTDGKYAKMRIRHYYCAGHVSGCMTIEYVYQGSGSRSFINSEKN